MEDSVQQRALSAGRIVGGLAGMGAHRDCGSPGTAFGSAGLHEMSFSRGGDALTPPAGRGPGVDPVTK
jgi:hypothetical protein